MVWGGADFGTDIGHCNFICPVVSTEESVFENYYIAKGSFPGKDQASIFLDVQASLAPTPLRVLDYS